MTEAGSELPPVARLLENAAWLQALARSVVADNAKAHRRMERVTVEGDRPA